MMVKNFNNLVSVTHQGKVLTFGNPTFSNSITSDVYFNVLDLKTTSTSDQMDWTGFNKVAFTNELRTVGMSIITLKETTDFPISPAEVPFKVISDQKYISIVRQSTYGTLYVNRFTLISSTVGVDKDEVEYSLQPGWEVRFERSQKEDIPLDKKDVQNYLNAEKTPFLEPTLELSMVCAVKDGAFDLLFLPNMDNGGYNWQFAINNKTDSTISLYNFPSDDNGLFDLTGKSINDSYQIVADKSLTLQLNNSPTVGFTSSTGPACALYTKQEKLLNSEGETVNVKRTGRVLFAFPGSDGTTPSTVTIDSAVTSTGVLADIPATIGADQIGVANNTILFNDYASVELAESGTTCLAITGPYHFSFWIYPSKIDSNNELIIGGDQSGDSKNFAPYVSLIDGYKIGVGFGDGTALVSTVMVENIIEQDNWYLIDVTYTGPGDNPFTVKVNGSAVSLAAVTAAANPSGAALTSIGTVFNGLIDTVAIGVAGADVATFNFDTVDYSVQPPTTPNGVEGSKITATVQGGKLVPSSCPVQSNTTGKLYVDDNGLTIYAGYLPFVQTAVTPMLVEGSDSLMHLYFANGATDRTDDFTVAHYSLIAQRPSFSLNWNQPAGTTTPEEGSINMVAMRSGTYLNGAAITTVSSFEDSYCDLTIADSLSGVTELWKGVPREINSFTAVINGDAVNDPNTPNLNNGAKVFYDYDAHYEGVWVPSSDTVEGSAFVFLTRYADFIPLSSVTITDNSANKQGTVNVEIENTVTKWTKGGNTGEAITQTWKGVPSGWENLVETLNGTSASYDYESTDFSNTFIYSLIANPNLNAQSSSRVLIYTQPAAGLTDLTVTIAGDDVNVCTVTVTGGGETYSLPDVPRNQLDFSTVLNGEDGSYPYPPNYVANIGDNIIVLNNGLVSYMLNQAGKECTSLLAGSNLFALFYTGSTYSTSTVTPIVATTAAIQQGATSTVGGTATAIKNTNLCISAAGSAPVNGVIANVMNSGGNAPRVKDGTNGGWIQEPADFAIGLNGSTQYIDFDVSKTNSSAEALAIAGDLTLEAWGKVSPTADASGVSRLLNYNVTGSAEFPDENFTYMMGYKNWDVPSLISASSVSGGFVMANNGYTDLTLAAFVNISNGGKLIGLSTISTLVEDYFSISSDSSGNITVYVDTKSACVFKANISGWVSIGATLKWTDASTATVTLYVNGVPSKTGAHSGAYSNILGTFYVGGFIGSSGGATMKVSQAVMWDKALAAGDMETLYETGILPSLESPTICWNLNDGPDSKNVAINSSPLGTYLNGKYKNVSSDMWSKNGGVFTAPFASNGEDALLSIGSGCRNWAHSALVFKQGFAVNLDSGDYVNCGNESTLNISEAGSIEVWVKPENPTNLLRSVISKKGSYEIRLQADGTVTGYINITSGDNSETVTVNSTVKIAAGDVGYIAFTFETRENPIDSSQKELKVTYTYEANLYVNGVLAKKVPSSAYSDPIYTDETNSDFLMGMSPGGNFSYAGKVGEVRFWSRALAAEETTYAYVNHKIPGNADSLVASWNFSEMKGKTAYDLNRASNGKLTSSDLWQFFPEIAVTELYVNGNPSPTVSVAASELGGLGGTGTFTIGGINSGTAVSSHLKGDFDEVRVWDIQLTGEQIQDSMNRPLSGAEDGLKGYWKCSTGSGLELADQTGRGNNGTFAPNAVATGPQWKSSDAPISNESPVVYNCINGKVRLYTAVISGTPSVIEYGDTQTNAYGDVVNVMKRAYLYVDSSGRTVLLTGFKIGDLDSIYVGQVQTKPTVIGYIEGAPPVPSENQTSPYWSGTTNPYDGSASVSFTEGEETNYSFSASTTDEFAFDLGLKLGLIAKTEVNMSAGIGGEAGAELFEIEMAGGLAANLNITTQNSSEQSLQNGHTLTTENSMTPSGNWEDASAMLNPTVGLRFITENTGMAVVKSATADLYLATIKGTNTPVKYSLVPNTEIPEDVNILTFPINPKYVKNGTLDGKVGFKNDPDYTNADSVRGSYFKPTEAYAIERKVNRLDKQLEGYYEQFSTSGGMTIDAFENKVSKNPAFDWSGKYSKRNLINKYVWTSSGGLHSEQNSVVDTYTESFTGSMSIGGGGGLYASGSFPVPVGPAFELDIMFSGKIEHSATKSKESSSSFELASAAEVDGDLSAPIIEVTDGVPVLTGTSDELAPGKVTGYRYMTFYIMPTESNFTNLMSEVIDPYWLANSNEANAVAFREASEASRGCWRIMHRVTFVSRVPAEFQPVNFETQGPDIDPPANLEYNVWITEIVEKNIAKDNPTMEEIGTAISAVLGTTKALPGILGGLIPWWPDFLEAASTYASTEYKELRDLKEDLLKYMYEKYSAQVNV